MPINKNGVEASCYTCKYSDKKHNEKPCSGCGWDNYEPEEGNGSRRCDDGCKYRLLKTAEEPCRSCREISTNPNVFSNFCLEREQPKEVTKFTFTKGISGKEEE